MLLRVVFPESFSYSEDVFPAISAIGKTLKFVIYVVMFLKSIYKITLY